MTAKKFDPGDAAPISSGKSVDPAEIKFCAKTKVVEAKPLHAAVPFGLKLV